MKSMNQIVGGNLKKIRELSGFTQDQVAKLIGLERSTYSNYEGGTREVPFDVLEKVASLFGCEPYLLFEDSVQADNEILVSAFRISDMEEADLREIANFKNVMMAYLRMNRIFNNDEAK